MEESAAAAKKFGMSTASVKGQEKKQQDNRLSMMLQRQAQVAKAKASGALNAPAAGAKRKPEKTVEVSVDDLLADFDAPSAVPKKKQSTLPRATKVLAVETRLAVEKKLLVQIFGGSALTVSFLSTAGGTACWCRGVAGQRHPVLPHG
jgi:hypothetical protein